MTEIKTKLNDTAIPFMFAVSKITVSGFKTNGTVERKFNNKKYPYKTTLSTTAATAALFKNYNY